MRTMWWDEQMMASLILDISKHVHEDERDSRCELSCFRPNGFYLACVPATVDQTASSPAARPSRHRADPREAFWIWACLSVSVPTVQKSNPWRPDSVIAHNISVR